MNTKKMSAAKRLMGNERYLCEFGRAEKMFARSFAFGVTAIERLNSL